MSSVSKRGQKGRTDFYQDPTWTVRARKFLGTAGMLAEILGPGNQTLLPPTPHPKTGEPYRYTTASTLECTAPVDLPVIPPDIAERLGITLAPWRKNQSCKLPMRPPTRASKLTDSDRMRHRRYAETILARDSNAIGAMASNSGRNIATYRLACRLGRWVHHGLIPQEQLIAAVFGACERNGLVRDDGRRAVLATIASGLAKSAGDALPDLGGRS